MVLKRVALAIALLGASAAAVSFGAAGGRGGLGVGDAGPLAGIQRKIGATGEEWMVIGAKLQRVLQLRAQVEAQAPAGNSNRNNQMMIFGAAGIPGSGSSMEGATAPKTGGTQGGLIGGMLLDLAGAGGARGPFAGPPVARAGPQGGFGNMFLVTQGNPVEALLGELQTLIDNKSTPEEQLREKLETIRATRKKARADLQAAQEDVMQLLTTRQIAILITLGYLT